MKISLMKSKDKIIINFIKKYDKGKIKILDVGAGDKLMKKELEKFSIYHSLDIDKSKNPDILCDLNKRFPIKDDSYDFVICSEVLEHTFYPKKIIKEIKRVVKKEGFIIISLPNEYNFYLRLKFVLGMQNNTEIPFREDLWKNHIHKARIKDILRLYKEEFKSIEIKYSWDSFSGKRVFLILDKIIRNFLMPLSKNLFSRSVIMIGNKNEK